MSTNKITDRENNNNQQGEKGHLPESGVIFFMKVDGVVLKSENGTMKASDVLALAGLNAKTHQLVQIGQDGCREPLPPDAVVDLKNYGVEEFQTEKLIVKVFYKDQPFKTHPGDTRITELKKLFGLPHACHLSVLLNEELKPLPDNGVICIQGGEHFASYPCDGKAS